MSTIKKYSLWIFKPHRTVLINNKTTKQHYFFFYYIYGLLPVSGLLSRRRCWWGPRPPRTVGLAARLFWGSPRESGACRPRLFDRSAGSCRWRGACGPAERRWVWREGPHWPSWRADQGLTSSSGWRLLLFRVRTGLFRSGLCSSSWERYLLFCADW